MEDIAVSFRSRGAAYQASSLLTSDRLATPEKTVVVGRCVIVETANKGKQAKATGELMNVEDQALAGAGKPRIVQSTYSIELQLSVTDAGALWAAAVEKGLGSPGATLDDLCDVLGPREDPDLSACLAMLTAPTAIPGCSLHDFEITRNRGNRAVKTAANDLATLRVGLGASA
jgi:hypothetical protein